MADNPEFKIECAGGCGRINCTNRPTVLWTPQYCPECASVDTTVESGE